ncbi:MAG: replication initiator protein A [Roseiarcus sp.]|jgi:plasmid replication initiation protein
MSRQQRLDLMPREQFAILSLHAKNDYLQTLAQNFAKQTGRDYQPLDKDALSRLRRYFSRRVFADLQLEGKPDTGLEGALRRLGEAIRAADRAVDIEAALAQELPKRTLRTATADDDPQLMFFSPSVYDAPIKDDVNLMDVAPFSLGKTIRTGVITYELKDCLITIEGGAEVGIATVFDYDIFLNMVSHLAEEVRRYRIEASKGLRPTLPPKIYRPNVANILTFSRRKSGGRQYEEVEEALRRLAKTSITITNLAGGTRRQVDTRSLLGEYSIISKTRTGKIDQIEIHIPDWVYLSVVRAEKALPLLTMNSDYFLISSGLGRFIYRLARKAAGKNEARYTARDLHKRSGSPQEYRFFLRDLKEFITRTQAFPMPDYDLTLINGREGPVVLMKRRHEANLEASDAPPLPLWKNSRAF